MAFEQSKNNKSLIHLANFTVEAQEFEFLFSGLNLIDDIASENLELEN